jgi:hypothetical protein
MYPGITFTWQFCTRVPSGESFSETLSTNYLINTKSFNTVVNSIHPSNGGTAQIGPWPPLLRFRNNNVLRCEVVSLTTNPRQLWGTYDFLSGFTPLAKGSSCKALKTRPPSHSHLLHNPLCIAPGPPRGGWDFGFAGRVCRLNTQEAFWYLTGHAYWH